MTAAVHLPTCNAYWPVELLGQWNAIARQVMATDEPVLLEGRPLAADVADLAASIREFERTEAVVEVLPAEDVALRITEKRTARQRKDAPEMDAKTRLSMAEVRDVRANRATGLAGFGNGVVYPEAPPRAALTVAPDPPPDDGDVLVPVDHGGGAIGDVAQLLGEQIAGRVRVRDRLLARQEETAAMLRAVNGEIGAITYAIQAYERARDGTATPAPAPSPAPVGRHGSSVWAQRFDAWAASHDGTVHIGSVGQHYQDTGHRAMSAMSRLVAQGEYERSGRGVYRRAQPGAQGGE